jgi:hypothetical protein
MIKSLTKEQRAKFPEYVDKWIKIGLCTEPADREKAENAIRGLYLLAKLRKPKIIWLPCPFSAALATVIYAKLINTKTVSSAVDSAIRSEVSLAVSSAVSLAIRSAVSLAVSSEVSLAVRSAIRSEVDLAVRSAIRSEVNSVIRSAVSLVVSLAVYSAVNSAASLVVSSAVRSEVYSAVDSAVDSAIRSEASSAVYSAVSSAADSAVSLVVDSAVDSEVRSAVNSAGRSFFGGSLWSGYQAWADYFNRELSIEIDRNYLDLSESCGYFWVLKDVCFASERPKEINLDESGRLHSEFKNSISYPSGWGLWHWHGVSIPKEWVTGNKPTASEALNWPNLELRRAACEIVGWKNILVELKSKVIDADDDPEIGTLLECEIPDSGKERFLQVKCATGRDFVLHVPKEMKTALESQAWMFQVDVSEFIKPEIRT